MTTLKGTTTFRCLRHKKSCEPNQERRTASDTRSCNVVDAAQRCCVSSERLRVICDGLDLRDLF
jgi:hypothetical protein